MLVQCMVLLAAVYYTVNGQVKCFCDRESCDENLVCQGEFCYIGLHRDENGESPRLRQHCGSASEIPFLAGSNSRCEERVDSWQEVCKCNENFCNTFAFLRSSIDYKTERKDEVVYTKQDHQPHLPTHQRPETPPPRNNNSSVVVLLVIIPLSVGGFTVCLIFLNYHCKMC